MRTKSAGKDKVCFGCEKSADNGVSYNDGGISRCSEDTSEKTSKRRKNNKWLSEQGSDCNAAVQRMNIMLIGCDDDAFAADVYKQCYNQFTAILRKSNISLNNEDAKYEEEVVSHFLRNIKTNVIKNHYAYLMNELCHDCYEISREFGLNESPACLRYTYIRETLTRHFGDEIQFSKVRKFVAVHSCKVNPYDLFSRYIIRP